MKDIYKFPALLFACMMGFALLASAEAAEPVEAHGMIWSSDMLAEYEKARYQAQAAADLLRVMVTAGTFDVDQIMAQAVKSSNLSVKMNEYWVITRTVNKLGENDLLCTEEEPVPLDPDLGCITDMECEIGGIMYRES